MAKGKHSGEGPVFRKKTLQFQTPTNRKLRETKKQKKKGSFLTFPIGKMAWGRVSSKRSSLVGAQDSKQKKAKIGAALSEFFPIG